MFPSLNPLLHSELRLAIMSLLVSHTEADFNFLKSTTNASSGNLSVQITKLKDAGYIDVIKIFKDNFPQTICKIPPLELHNLKNMYWLSNLLSKKIRFYK